MRARIRDTEIYFDVVGAGLVSDGTEMREKPAAFVIHGGPGADHTTLKPALSPLADRLQLVFFDHRGQGRSARGFITAASLGNAAQAVSASGGSTNAVLHLTAIAAEAGVAFGIEDCDAACRDTPVICDLKPSGKYLAVGDVLTFRREMRNQAGVLEHVTVTVGIGGTVRGLPGTSAVGSGVPLAIYGSYDTLGPLIDLARSQNIDPQRYLVDLRAGADWRTAEEGIRSLGASGIRVAAEEVEQLRSVPLFRAFFGFMELEMAFMVVVLTAGLGLILYAATLEREVELASIRARGASGWQTAGLLVGEASSIMLVGIVVGAGIGVLTAYLSTTLGVSGAGESLVPLFLIVPVTSLLLLAAAPIAMLIVSFLVSLRVARMDIGRVLKLRGG